jgi:hypothetical protein
MKKVISFHAQGEERIECSEVETYDNNKKEK